ncbi:hypothetical protein SAMN05444380_11573 [Thermophagus xiamenensis]|uniref:Uncharacterized protein n=1 Tax=Thermophagus xiamenensis TaxID=385682 RepID=A0A1I2CBJ5_9BACT|nr:hypothetical protein SAMN05444380_11573 [Thermophagus xiamenensis]
MVRLKLPRAFFCSIFLRFQFHYGSIEAVFKSSCQPINFLFQFHYGSIEAIDGQSIPVVTPYFNSTMVRLKQGITKMIVSNPLFQFHYGSIEAGQRFQFLILV